jgi:hypothetical protein
MLFFRHWMTIGIPFVDKFCRGLYLSHTWNTTWHSPICQPSVVGSFTYFSWDPAVIWCVWNTHNRWRFLNLIFYFIFSNTQTQCLSDSEISQISRTGGSLILTIFWIKLTGITNSNTHPTLVFFLGDPCSHWWVPLSVLPLVPFCDIKSTLGNPCCTLELALVEPVIISVVWVSDLQCYILGFRVKFLWIETKLWLIYLFIYLFC